MKVSLFIPCLTDQFFPASGMHMVHVLERLGVEVLYNPEQTCCGQPAFNTGYHHEARHLARKFLNIFDRDGSEYIVAPSGSCVTMVAEFYGRMLDVGDDMTEQAERVRGRIHEFTSFLVDVMNITDVGARFEGRVTMHDSCHALRELHIKRQPRMLLEKVAGLELVEMDAAEECCGFGGTFAVKFDSLSAAMAERKAESVERSGADFVTGVDSSCLMQIDGMLRRRNSNIRALHIAEILGELG